MPNAIEVSSGYVGLVLTCGEADFNRIAGYLLTEPSVAEAVGDQSR